MHELARAVWEYHRYGIPVIAEMLPFDPNLNTSAETIADVSRIGAEIGADIIKTSFTKNFESVVTGCPVPVIIAGGAKVQEFLKTVEKAVQSGAGGLAMGRNLYQHENPVQLANDVAGILRRKS